jgi:hypothetical protein
MPRVIERTVYTFSELSEKAKEKARDWYRETLHDESDWWDQIYEDASTIAGLMGVSISNKHVRGTPIHNSPSIYFSGFCSQGDGASFEGRYTYKPDAIEAITEYAPRDTELLRIATELTLLQTTARLTTGRRLEARIKAHGSDGGNYSHSGTMNIEVTYQHEEDGVSPPDDQDKTLTALMRDFADWIYEQLEAEDTWRYSDECIDEYLKESSANHEFDEFGSVI